MIQEITKTAKEAGYAVTPLVDYSAVEVCISEQTKKGTSAFYVMMPRDDVRQKGEYDYTTEQTIELLGAVPCPFSNSDIEDFKNVERIASRLKGNLLEIIDALEISGRYEAIEQVRFTIIPFRFSAFCTCVTATFTLKKNIEVC